MKIRKLALFGMIAVIIMASFGAYASATTSFLHTTSTIQSTVVTQSGVPQTITLTVNDSLIEVYPTTITTVISGTTVTTTIYNNVTTTCTASYDSNSC